MAIYTWPTGDRAFVPERVIWTPRHNRRSATSVLNGATQTVALPGMRWSLTADFPTQTYAERAQLEGWLMRLNGQEHRAMIWDLARPVPRGTCNLSGVLASANAQFSSSIGIYGCGASRTLLAGDWLRITTSTGSQLVQVAADATANASGVISGLEVRPSLRGATANGAAVVLQQASALFVLAEPDLAVPRGGAGICPPFSVEFIEVFA